MRVCALAVVLIVASGCMIQAFQGVPGSGTVKQESREVGDFTSVEVGNALQATVRVGAKAPVVLKGDDNLLPLVTTEVSGGRLVVAVRAGASVSPTQPITVEVTTPVLEGVEAHGASKIDAVAARAEQFAIAASGASRVDVGALDSDAVTVALSGASHATLKGQTKSVALEVSGASNLKASALAAETVTIEVSGASRAEVSASAAVKGDASGASQVRVGGGPAVKQVDTSGAARVTYQAATPRE